MAGNGNNRSGFLRGFLIGSFLGALAGILLAPKPGKELRSELKEKGGRPSTKQSIFTQKRGVKRRPFLKRHALKRRRF